MHELDEAAIEAGRRGHLARFERIAAEMDSRDDLDGRLRDRGLSDTPPKDDHERAAEMGAIDDALEDVNHWGEKVVAQPKAKRGMIDRQRDAQAAYMDYLHAKLMLAEEATTGLHSPLGTKKGISDYALLDGSLTQAQMEKYASEELLRWLIYNPVLTYSQFAADYLGWANLKRNARNRRAENRNRW